MKIGLLQFNVAYGLPASNRATVAKYLTEIQDQAIDVILLPEMWTSGYALKSLDQLADQDNEPTGTTLRAWARQTGATIVGGSIPVRQGDGFVNRMLAFGPDGQQKLSYDKVHLFSLMEEDRYLIAGNQTGNFSIGTVPCGAVICYDLRFPEWIRKTVIGGCAVLFVAAQWPTARLDHWRLLIQARAIENQCFVVACNRTGDDGRGTHFPGHSMVIDPWGRIVAEADEQPGWLWAEIDLEQVEQVRRTIPVFRDRRTELYS
ncbi:carbon-nitrogen family hydrolase [Heliophilum fasciatum]|uniref:Putative amidohydrolase n=1 Tax=Heliophilum fasciatum TaxID=35700 RepID=A0A4V2SXR8_9FIRM|nr:carbon-nitrogen family hydrolase [Heliophilum fasciatum]MCW2277380.1 putative amidohydrolase [Heliophilum fasciatum]TCP67216.1 putative amidohydrolase [Heliophilum fasciatum]